MKVTLESTSNLIEVKINGVLVPARIWEGQTDTGIAVHAYITRIAVKETDDTAQFEKELAECRAPSPEIEAIPSRLVL